MSRCISCNEAINAVEKTAIESLVPSKVYAWKEDFFQCSSCAKVYWEGSHYENMMMFLDEVGSSR